MVDWNPRSDSFTLGKWSGHYIAYIDHLGPHITLNNLTDLSDIILSQQLPLSGTRSRKTVFEVPPGKVYENG
jgi:hypothetical protein